MKRITSIDFVRGLVMIIMALDHTRDFLHIHADQDPTDLTTTTPILFVTRWITHLCAPTFVFLSGISAFLSGQNNKDNSTFLLRRGILLIIIEFTLVNFALWMDIRFRTLIFEVIGAIGAGFILLAALVKVPVKWLGIIGITIIFTHDLVTGFMPSNLIGRNTIALLFSRTVIPLGGDRLLILGYAVLPWFGIMLTGFACGPVLLQPSPNRSRWFLRNGIAALLLFLLLRAANIYGDPSPWTMQKNAIFTCMSFFNTSKYPPSLLFTLLMLGIIALIIALSEPNTVDNLSAIGKNPSSHPRKTSIIRIVSVYGRTPLFYFIVHLYILHAAMFIMLFLQGFTPEDLVFGPAKTGRPATTAGLSLKYVYLIWAAVVALMYPLCYWYGGYKRNHPEKRWLRYL